MQNTPPRPSSFVQSPPGPPKKKTLLVGVGVGVTLALLLIVGVVLRKNEKNRRLKQALAVEAQAAAQAERDYAAGASRRRIDAACRLGTRAGLPPAEPWTDVGGEFMCMSKAKKWGDGEIRFWVKGTEHHAEAIELTLFVNNFTPLAVAASGQHQLAEDFAAIWPATATEPVPEQALDIIRQGLNGESSGPRLLRLTKRPNVNGDGYEYRVRLAL